VSELLKLVKSQGRMSLKIYDFQGSL